MAFNPKSLENLKQFKEGVSGNPAGYSKKARLKDEMRKKVVQNMMEVFGVTELKGLLKRRLREDDINEWEKALMTMDTNQLQAIAKWDKCPTYVKGLAIAILIDMKNGKTKTIDKLRDRQFGKAIQRVEITGADGEPLNQAKPITTEEAREILKNLENEY